MRIAKVVGKVTLSRCHPSFHGARLRLVVPCTKKELQDESEPQGESLAAWDEYGAGEGSLIALSEGPEASQPFRPELKPVDAYIAAILDTVEINDKTS